MTDFESNQPHLFMTKARRRLSPNAFAHLTQIVGMFNMETITRETAHAQAAPLFYHHPELLVDFRAFLPLEDRPKSRWERVQGALKKFKNKVMGGRKGTR